ncbi:hypothetical protein [Sphingomonas solaris]|uniref:Uncharacterized protein n=1 Tax=Alterirhizorhabdus solaris TaxID=2529389 RepID=A0A558R889_9SPHN|nr:hypothetical protein [Sphingomonas solaris]TVV75576.1 hypothetical protein FOY91_06865 [Sphingomonas solaris]
MRPAPVELRRVRYRGLITPSAINSWRGSREEGAKFTARQLHIMRLDGIDPDSVAVIEVRSVATAREWEHRPGEPMPVYVLECPVLGAERRDGRVEVLSPAGHRKLVYRDGSISRPRTKRSSPGRGL